MFGELVFRFVILSAAKEPRLRFASFAALRMTISFFPDPQLTISFFPRPATDNFLPLTRN
jgi:hypothetical protein